ncbi:MAG: DUF1003 domain-containing protein [Desulfobacteraceae bacterium]|nr:DUF1003 domain-containing protein [Desulfobacteraceae bacterium]
MPHPPFPPPYHHKHAPIKNANEVVEEQITLGQRAADWIATKVGSWEFIIGQSTILTIWAILNVTAWVRHWDPYPFILMNLVLSLQAAYTAPMIMMSQNRKADRDRIEAHIDYEVNLKAETEIEAILKNLDAQNIVIAELHEMLAELHGRVAAEGILPNRSGD